MVSNFWRNTYAGIVKKWNLWIYFMDSSDGNEKLRLLKVDFIPGYLLIAIWTRLLALYIQRLIIIQKTDLLTYFSPSIWKRKYFTKINLEVLLTWVSFDLMHLNNISFELYKFSRHIAKENRTLT